MAKSLATLKSRIAREIRRVDLDTEIADAISDAIDTYQGDRFWFNEPSLATNPTFNTVIGQDTYDGTVVPAVGLMYKIDYLTYQQAGTTFKIVRRTPEEVQLQNQTGFIAGPPSIFCYAGGAISISPVPDAIYPIKIFGHINMAPPTDDADDTSVWTNVAEKLIRARAKYEVAVHVTRNQAMMQAMHPDQDKGPGGGPGATYSAWQELKQTTNKLTATGYIEAMQF